MHLLIDQGGSSSRAFVVAANGRAISSAQSKVQTQVSQVSDTCYVEQCPAQILSSIKSVINSALADACKMLNQPQVAITSAALVTQRSSFVAVQKSSGNPITQIISWQDTRAANELDAIVKNDETLAPLISQATGLRASAHYGASKMAWLLKYNALVKEAARNDDLVFLPIASYICSVLNSFKNATATQALPPYTVDPANASRTLLMNKKSQQWHEKLLDVFTIKPQWLPQIVSTTSHFATVSSKQFPLLAANVELAYVNGDQSAAFFSHGMPKKTSLKINVGTGAFVSMRQPQLSAVQQESLRKSGLLTSIVYANVDHSYYVLEGTVNGAGAALDYIAKKHEMKHVENELLAIEQQFSHQLITHAPIFINTIGGLAAPFWRTDITSHFIDIQTMKDHTEFNLELYAVLESIIFLIANLIKQFQQYQAVKELALSGGVANSNLFCQLLADLSGITLVRSANREASISGSFYGLTGKNGIRLKCDNEDSNATLSTVSTTENTENENTVFQPKNGEILHARFTRWLNELQRLLA